MYSEQLIANFREVWNQATFVAQQSPQWPLSDSSRAPIGCFWITTPICPCTRSPFGPLAGFKWNTQQSNHEVSLYLPGYSANGDDR